VTAPTAQRPKRVLLVKTSSLGDVLHSFPAVTDAVRADPELILDWVVEEDFAGIVGRHPLVRGVVPIRFRYWRGRPFGALNGPLQRFWREFRAQDYDLVIDAQGLIKSAAIAKLARGPVHGFDKASAREALAARTYDVGHNIPQDLHAAVRLRRLFAAVLGYALPEGPGDSGFPPRNPADVEDYLVFLHGAGYPSKRWPEEHWKGLAEIAANAGYTIRLPGYSEADRARAEAIGSGNRAVTFTPTASLEAAWELIEKAAGVVTLDTGLGHLSAALNVPTFGLWGPNDYRRTGLSGAYQAHIASDMECAPCLKRSCRLLEDKTQPGICMDRLAPEVVWAGLTDLMAKSSSPA